MIIQKYFKSNVFNKHMSICNIGCAVDKYLNAIKISVCYNE